MKKLSGLLAVSLVAIMMAPAARADIASTAYVDNKDTAIRNDMEAKANKATKNYTSGSITQYPSIKVAEDIAKIAAGAAVGNYALKTELKEEADARGQADTAIKADIKKNADAITVINNSAVMNSGATKAKIDAIATNTTAAANAKSAADAAQTTANAAVVANTAITGSTKTKITYDAKGLVTGGSDLTAADIPTLATSKISGLDTVLAAKFVAPGTSAISTDGTYTLTMKVADGKPTYAWEKIGRE